MVWWLLLFAFPLYSEDRMVERYCYASSQEALRAQSRLNNISVPSDRIEREDHCLVVSMNAHRRELIQRYLRTTEPNFEIVFSSAEQSNNPCKLKVEKIKVSKEQSTQGQINKRVTILSSTSQANGSEVFRIQTLKNFSLSINQDAIQGECRFINGQRYEITLRVEKKEKPLVPALSPGSVVVISTPPADQQTMMMETQLQLGPGDRIEIGALVKEMKDKSHRASIDPDVQGEIRNGLNEERVFLSLD